MTAKKNSETKVTKTKRTRVTTEARVDAAPTGEPAPKKTPRSKREKAPKDALMTFAFRMPKAESAALHKAAGPANASRVMRALAGAFVSEDRAVFAQILEDARKLRE